jgi:hypothetical protein
VAGGRATGGPPLGLFAFTDAELLPERSLQGRREVDVLCPCRAQQFDRNREIGPRLHLGVRL